MPDVDGGDGEPWYSVRCILAFGSESGGEGRIYEERVTLWRALSFEDAVRLAEEEARLYVEGLDGEYVGLTQAFHLACSGSVGDGDEVFSLLRDSDLAPDEYIARFFDTGQERQGSLGK
jgi:hypothetical protein